METHHAGQEEMLMEIMVQTDNLEVIHRPRGSPANRSGYFKCAVALATVMGLVIVALVTAFILQFFIFKPSCNQDAPALNSTAKVNMAYKLKRSDELGRYDIFTVDKAATYLLYGWVTFSDVPCEEVTLMQMMKGTQRTLQKKSTNETEIFFFNKVKLVSGSRVIIYLKSSFTDSLFHVYEL